MSIELFNLDCLHAMRAMPRGSVHLVFCDPPYNVGKDYGDEYNDSMTDSDYESFMYDVIYESRRISNGRVVFYVGSKLTKLFSKLIPDSHLIVVVKRAIGIMEGNFFLQYHSLFTTAPPLVKCKDVWDDIRLPGEGYFYRAKRYGHPGETSLQLCKRVLTKFTKEGYIVCDPMFGTGTMAVACHQLGRSFVGTELINKWYRVAVDRLKEEQMQLSFGL